MMAKNGSHTREFDTFGFKTSDGKVHVIASEWVSVQRLHNRDDLVNLFDVSLRWHGEIIGFEEATQRIKVGEDYRLTKPSFRRSWDYFAERKPEPIPQDAISVVCKAVEYREGVQESVQGVKKGAVSRQLANGGYFSPRTYSGSGHSYGWGDITIPSQLILTVIIDGRKEKLEISWFFKKNEFRLTRKRQELIRRTMPASIHVIEGEEGWTVVEEELERWLGRVASAM